MGHQKMIMRHIKVQKEEKTSETSHHDFEKMKSEIVAKIETTKDELLNTIKETQSDSHDLLQANFYSRKLKSLRSRDNSNQNVNQKKNIEI